MLESGKTGWIVCSEVVGHDPGDFSGRCFLGYRLHKLGVICRLSNGRYPLGTIRRTPASREILRAVVQTSSAPAQDVTS